MAAELSWGIIGTGSIAHTFARALGESRTGRLVGVGSRNQAGADAFGAEFDIPHRHASYQALLDDEAIDAVYISTPHPMHAEWAIKAARAGKHILCEKPLTVTAADAVKVVEAARRHGVFLMEAFMYRCHPLMARVAEIVRSGEIGRVGLIDATFSYHESDDSESRIIRRDLGGGGILDVGCYPTSFAKMIAAAALGRETAAPLEVKAIGRLHEVALVDVVTAALLKFEGDILAQVATGITLEQESSARVYGTEGSIYIASPWFCDSGLVVRLNNGASREEKPEPGASLYALEADAFAAGVASGKAPWPAMSTEDTLQNMAILDAWRAEVGVVFTPAEAGSPA